MVMELLLHWLIAFGALALMGLALYFIVRLAVRHAMREALRELARKLWEEEDDPGDQF